ncbi:MAG TPA: hypothetical protein VFQ67_16910 [Allosphingosinicella sp.]|jgi:hypothetical protein|nr:hypothetical protein [Allosphingosinicella sp.]
MTFKRLFKWLTLAALAALLVALLRTGVPDGLAAWAGLLFLFAWIGGPAASAYLLSSGDREGTARKILFVFFLVAAGLTARTFAAVWAADRSTAAIGLFFLPLYTWSGLIATALGTATASGWRPSLSGPAAPPRRRSPPPG